MIRKAAWLLLYGMLAVLDFLVTWAKDAVEEQLRGKRSDPPAEDR